MDLAYRWSLDESLGSIVRFVESPETIRASPRAHSGGPQTHYDDLALGERLRPVMLGASLPELAALSDGQAPGLSLGVHSAAGDVLGYVVIDELRPGRTLGGIDHADNLSIRDAMLIARSTSMQFRLCGIDRAASHAVICPARGRNRVSDRAAYLEAVRPLVDARIFDLSYTNDEGVFDPLHARDATVVSAAASVFGLLDHLAMDPGATTYSVPLRTPLAAELSVSLQLAGLTERRDGRGNAADIIILDGKSGFLELEAVAATRARGLILLSVLVPTAATEAFLADRGTIVIPHTLATAGRSIALHLSEGETDLSSTLVRASTRVRRLTASLLDTAKRRGEPLPAIIRVAGQA